MKNEYRKILLGILILGLFAACEMPFDDSASGGTASSAEYALPADTIEDSPRVFSGSFTFETLVPVELDLGFRLYDSDQTDSLEPLTFSGLEEDAVPMIYVSAKDPAGNPSFSGAVAANANLNTTLYLPSALETIELFVEAEGFETRRMTLTDMPNKAVIRRTLSMRRAGSANSMSLNVQNRESGPLKDSDGDGVPDSYDLYPDDPEAAFGMNVPSAESISIAFEDLFGQKNAGDADYNDFIASYTINEVMNADGLITRVEVQAAAKEKLAGYSHAFGIRLDSYTGRAKLSGSFVNSGGRNARLAGSPKAPAEIVLFSNTSRAVGASAWFVLEFEEAQDPAELSRPPYNPYLYVYDTRHDIHLIDAEPLSRSINSNDRFVDADGFPWALLIPADWTPPVDAQRIEDVYPYFTDWRESDGAEYVDWYEKSGDDPGENGVPALTGANATDEDPDTEGIQYRYYYNEAPFTINLELDSSIVSSEDILFKSTDLPDHISLDEATGIVTVEWYELESAADETSTVYFWSEGSASGDDTSDQPLRIDFIAYVS